MINIKEINSSELEIVLKEHCKKYNYIFSDFYYNPNTKWLVLCFGIEIKTWCKKDIQYQCYCMQLNDEYVFIDVMRGLTKQLKGVKIMDIENIKIKL